MEMASGEATPGSGYPGSVTDIEGVAGVLVWTSSDRYAAMEDFYVRTLGLEPRSKRSGFVNFEWGSTRLTVSIHEQVLGASGDPSRIMVNLLVSDIQRVASELRAKGVQFSRQPEREPWGGWIATFSDPDGNILQLLQSA